MASFTSFCHLLSLLLCLTIVHATPAAASSESVEMVDEVCRNTSSYTFCNDSLYSDPATAHASGFDLAYISVDLAYANATSTQKRISELLLKNGSDGADRPRLERCRLDYAVAVEEIEVASGDVNSESFYDLPDFAVNASRAADDCEAAFLGAPSHPLGQSNQNLKGLCEIFGIVAKLWISSDNDDHLMH